MYIVNTMVVLEQSGRMGGSGTGYVYFARNIQTAFAFHTENPGNSNSTMHAKRVTY